MPNDTAPAWDAVPLNPEKDAAHAVQERNGSVLVLLWRDPWWIGPFGASSKPSELIARGVRYLGPCLTPSEVTARERAAYAAGALAMREVVLIWLTEESRRETMDAYRYKDRDEGGDGSREDGLNAAATYLDAAQAIRALPIPDDASAALAEVVRRAKREAFQDAALMLDEKATDLQRQYGIGPDSFCVVTLRAKAAAIRARSEGGEA